MRRFAKKISRRNIQVILGLLWVINGLLQLQRQMFTANFANKVISPVAQGQPMFVSGPMHFFIHIFLLNPVLFNVFTIITQLGIGYLILNKKTVRYGLIASIFWGLFVWIIGEGYGDIFGFHTLVLMGAPGAALLYVLLAVAVLPKQTDKNSTKTDTYPAYWRVFVWAFIWILGGVYLLLPGQNNVSTLS